MTRIIDEKLLKSFREKEQCERCGRRTMVQPHHVFGRGQESCRRMDLPISLIALCVTCHDRVHWGRIDRHNLLEIIARREKMTPEAIIDRIWYLRRLP